MPWVLIASLSWLAFSVALAAWWLVFALSQADQLNQLGATQDFQRKHRMIMSEGGFLIFLLLAGGVALIYYSWRETERTRRMKDFFAAFTHDLKTALASIRLQAESLSEDLSKGPQSNLISRLLNDTNRLELHLENSLLVSATELNGELLRETVEFSHILENLQRDWPDLRFSVDAQARQARLQGDSRAISSIFRNIIHNAVRHGGATTIDISCRTDSSGLSFSVQDNGKGFSGDRKRLGEMYLRHTATSGSGLGLYLVRTLASAMGGSAEFKPGTGFQVAVTLPQAGVK